MRILIVDDCDGIRRGIRRVLASSSDWTVCGEATDGVEAIEMAKDLRPDVILIDISMPRMNGLDATRVIRRDVPESKIIIVSQDDTDIVCQQAEVVGAVAGVSKNNLAKDLTAIIHDVITSSSGDNQSNVISQPSKQMFAAEPTQESQEVDIFGVDLSC